MPHNVSNCYKVILKKTYKIKKSSSGQSVSVVNISVVNGTWTFLVAFGNLTQRWSFHPLIISLYLIFESIVIKKLDYTLIFLHVPLKGFGIVVAVSIENFQFSQTLDAVGAVVHRAYVIIRKTEYTQLGQA